MSDDRLAIVEACTRLINQYARLNDSGDFGSLAAMFTEDGVFVRPAQPNEEIAGRAAILASFQGRPPRSTCHIVSNIEIEVETHQRARAVSRIVLYVGAKTETPTDIVSTLVGTFHDVLVKVADTWFFQERRGSICLRGTTSVQGG